MTRKALSLAYYLIAAAIVSGVVFIYIHRQSASSGDQSKSEAGPPFEVAIDRLDQEHSLRDIVIILSKQHYSQDNLNTVFRLYTRKYKKQAGMLSIRVYHDRGQISFLKPGNDKDQDMDDCDAFFISTYSYTVGEPKELYYYHPNIDRREEIRRVSLKGDPCDASFLDKFIEKWQTTNQEFNVRVISFECQDVTPSGTYYAFQVCGIDEDDRERCHHIMTIRRDEVVPIPSQQVRFVNDQIAYIFMGWKYAVTVDGGKSWSVWDAEEELLGWKCCDSTLIRDVAIFPDGSGTMKLNQTLKNGVESQPLQTKDYGRHWNSNVK